MHSETSEEQNLKSNGIRRFFHYFEKRKRLESMGDSLRVDESKSFSLYSFMEICKSGATSEE